MPKPELELMRDFLRTYRHYHQLSEAIYNHPDIDSMTDEVVESTIDAFRTTSDKLDNLWAEICSGS